MAIMSCSLVDLPGPVWPYLFEQLLADGHSGLAAAAAFELTCKAVLSRATYTNLQLKEMISDPTHSFWAWLARRLGGISGLSLHVNLFPWQPGHLQAWQHPLSLLAQIPGLHLKLSAPRIYSGDHDFYTLTHAFLHQHGQLISKLSLGYSIVEPDHVRLVLLPGLVPQQCSDVEFLLWTEGADEVDLAGLQPLAGKPSGLRVEGGTEERVVGVSTLTALSKLTGLSLGFDMPLAEPWTILAALTGLQKLACKINTTGDAAPLSILTGMTCLCLD
jgi:hypothetical protein